jgi:hypothetical protein
MEPSGFDHGASSSVSEGGLELLEQKSRKTASRPLTRLGRRSLARSASRCLLIRPTALSAVSRPLILDVFRMTAQDLLPPARGMLT